MANLIHLFASQVFVPSKTERESFAPSPNRETSAGREPLGFTNSTDEFALPSGVLSMEHWLDLNA